LKPFKIFILLIIICSYSSQAVSQFIEFSGAARTLFGSSHLINTGNLNIVLDCGIYLEPELLNKNSIPPFTPEAVDVIAISHAHLDHTGRLPLMTKYNFKGKILATEPTIELSKIMLPLMLFIKNNDISTPASDINKVIHKKNIRQVISFFKPLNLHEEFTLKDGTIIKFFPTSHILGSVMIMVKLSSGKNILFTGDFGNPYNYFLMPTEVPSEKVDILIIESTYGGKKHQNIFRDLNKLAQTIEAAVLNRSHIAIPSYALSRTQKILYFLNMMYKEKLIPENIRIVVDSRVANKITKIYEKFSNFLNPVILNKAGSSKSLFKLPVLKKYIRNYKLSTVIAIAPGGMCDNGNIQKYLKMFLPFPENHIVFVGFQPEFSTGYKILHKQKYISINGASVPNRAKTLMLDSFSGHADHIQYIDFIKKLKGLKKIFIVHGFFKNAEALKKGIKNEPSLKNIEIFIPRENERFKL